MLISAEGGCHSSVQSYIYRMADVVESSMADSGECFMAVSEKATFLSKKTLSKLRGELMTGNARRGYDFNATSEGRAKLVTKWERYIKAVVASH